MKKIKTKDWILITILIASLIGCIVQFQRRYLFFYFFLPFIFSVFFLVESRICKGKMMILKKLGLFLVMMFLIYCSGVFFITSIPVIGGRNQGSEMYLKKLDSMEQISIPSMNGDLDGWLYKQSEEKAPLIIFFNGAGECSAGTVKMFYENGILSEYFPDYNFLCTDYPSYGFSDGYVSEASMKEFALDTYDAAIDWSFVDPSSVTVMGYSIGTGPATFLAAKRDLKSLVLLAPYEDFWNNTLRNMKRTENTWNGKKVGTKVERVFYRLFWGYNVDPYDYAKSIDEQVLMISSMDDTTITHEASMKVADRLKNCTVITLTGIKHEDLLCNTSYEAINQFMYQ